jgi:streptomycin 6-kinase
MTVLLKVRDKVRATAEAQGAAGRSWLTNVGDSVSALAAEWGLTLGQQRSGGTASVVVEATTADGQEAALKVCVPGLDPTFSELRLLLAANGRGYARVLRHDKSREAILLERLGPKLAELGVSIDKQIDAICSTLLRAWAPLPEGETFMTGAEKAENLATFIENAWRDLGRPCAEKTIQVACSYAESRARDFDPSTAVLAHGDAHAWNLLVDPSRGAEAFKFVDPDGLFVERAYDLSISMREWSEELLAGDPVALAHRRCRRLAALARVGAEPIWQWGLIERTSNGLLWLQQDMPGLAREFLTVADSWAKPAHLDAPVYVRR